MSPATIVRQLFFPVLLAVTSLGLWQAAERLDFAVVTTDDIVYEAEPRTQAFAARRIPRTLLAPISDAAVSADMADVVETAPSGTCIAATVPNGPVEPSQEVPGGLIPASNQKVLTTFAALELLGPDFRYVTTVASPSTPAGGTLDGDLYLIGAGDPYLATEAWMSQYQPSRADWVGSNEPTVGRTFTRLEDLADRVVEAGITSIVGEVIGDESLLDDVRYGNWPSRHIDGNQSGPISALTVNEGFTNWPEVFRESVRPREQATDPVVNAASVFEQLLVERGVTTNGSSAGLAPAGAAPIASVESPPLSAIATHVNSYSSNIGAELLLKRVGLEQFSTGSTEAGAEAVRSLLSERGVDLDDVVLSDGSGLSDGNRLTCRALTSLLTISGGDSVLAETMAISGTRGSLLERFTAPRLTGRVKAKTGTLANSIALTGWVTSEVDGTSSQFAVITNDDRVVLSDVEELHEALVEALVQRPAGPRLDRLSPLGASPVETADG